MRVHACALQKRFMVCAGVVRRVRGAEPADSGAPEHSGRGGPGGAEGPAAAAERRMLQTGQPAGVQTECAAVSPPLPQHRSRGVTFTMKCKSSTWFARGGYACRHRSVFPTLPQEVRAIYWQSEGCRFDPSPSCVSKCPWAETQPPVAPQPAGWCLAFQPVAVERVCEWVSGRH